MNLMYGKIVDFVHMMIKNSYEDKKDLTFVDATAGNGFDTIFLCKLSKDNFVYAFDIQEKAVNNTEKLLKQNNCINYKVILDSHENIDNYIEENIDVCLFNLGYLPQSDKIVKTNYVSTIKAIDIVINKLSLCGKIFICAYRLHDEGYESCKVLNYISKLDNNKYNVLKISLLNKNNMPPEIYVIERCK